MLAAIAAVEIRNPDIMMVPASITPTMSRTKNIATKPTIMVNAAGRMTFSFPKRSIRRPPRTDATDASVNTTAKMIGYVSKRKKACM